MKQMPEEMPEREPFETALRPSTSSRVVWVVIGLAVLAAAGIGFWLWKDSRGPAPVAPAVESQPTAAPAPPPPPTLPMADGDSLARQLGAELSQAAELAKWLSEPDILRRLVAAVNLIAEGNSPRPVLSFLVPSQNFEVIRSGGKLHPSPKSYARYESIARVLTALDPAALAKAYGRLKPYVDSAFAQIGRPGQSFDGVLHQAIASLAGTPLPQTAPDLEEKGLVYAYRDPKLEQLSAAQKQLLRMGPESARAIQAWLKKLDEAMAKSSP